MRTLSLAFNTLDEGVYYYLLGQLVFYGRTVVLGEYGKWDQMKNPVSHKRWNTEFMIAHSLSVFAYFPYLFAIYQSVRRSILNYEPRTKNLKLKPKNSRSDR